MQTRVAAVDFPTLGCHNSSLIFASIARTLGQGQVQRHEVDRVFSSTYKSISGVSPSMAYRNDRLNSHFEMVPRRSHARRRSRYSRTAAFRSRGWAHHLRWRTRAPARCRRARAPQEGAHRDARRDSGAGRAHQVRLRTRMARRRNASRSEEHTSELQSHLNLVCRLLLEKKKKHKRDVLLSQEKKKQPQN